MNPTHLFSTSSVARPIEEQEIAEITDNRDGEERHGPCPACT